MVCSCNMCYNNRLLQLNLLFYIVDTKTHILGPYAHSTPPISVNSHQGSQTVIDRCACAFKRVVLSICMFLLSQFAHAYDCRVLHETNSCCFVFTQSVNACLHFLLVSSLLSLTADLSVLGCNRRASLRCEF